MESGRRRVPLHEAPPLPISPRIGRAAKADRVIVAVGLRLPAVRRTGPVHIGSESAIGQATQLTGCSPRSAFPALQKGLYRCFAAALIPGQLTCSRARSHWPFSTQEA